MARNLLHKDRLPEFLAWCRAEGIPVRPGVGQWQLHQIKPRKDRTQWEAVYARLDMPEHVTVTAGLERTVRRFIDVTRKHPKANNYVELPSNSVQHPRLEGAGEPGAGERRPQKARLFEPPRS